MKKVNKLIFYLMISLKSYKLFGFLVEFIFRAKILLTKKFYRFWGFDRAIGEE
jgi:hypothetical protein